MPSKSERLTSLDAFRGIAIAGMILVNNPGSWSHIYAPLEHAEWHGWTLTDLIFPFFLFIIGVAMTFSFAKQLAGAKTRQSIYLRIVKRTCILFGLGLFLNGFPHYHFATIRIPGVLQRIAVVYLFASILTLNTNAKGLAWVTAGLLLFYWGLMKLIPVPGHGAGDLSVTGNLAAYVDNHLLHGHMWKETWDPEGLLSTLPAVASTLSGVLVGYWIRSGKEKREIAGWMFVSGWAAILAGLVWHNWFPINKNLWTSSYVLFTSGAALQFLGVCYWLIEVQGIKRWAYPAIVYGMNSIAVFVLSGLEARLTILIKVHAANGGTVALKSWLYQNIFASWAGPLNGSLAFAIANILFWLGLMAILYHKRIFIKI
ncbi:MAG: acyltransferase family protein [bacterium]